MARGKKRNSVRRSGSRPKRRKHVVSKQDVHHFKEFGEVHPSDESHVVAKGRTIVKVNDEEDNMSSSDSSSEEEVLDPYKQLLSVLGPSNCKSNNNAIDSEDSEGSSVEEGTEGQEKVSPVESGSDEDNISETSSIVKDDQPINERLLDTLPDSKVSGIAKSGGECSEDENDEQDKEDPFFKHLKSELNAELLEKLSRIPSKLEKIKMKWPTLGDLIVYLPKVSCSKLISHTEVISNNSNKVNAKPACLPKLMNITGQSWSTLHLKEKLHKNLQKANSFGLIDTINDTKINFTPLQNEMFSIINSYKDIYFPERKSVNSEEVRFVYTLHAVNHVLKTRNEIVKHNSLLEKNSGEVPDEFRDQGLVRPKVLILVPFRDKALRIVQMLISLLVPNKKDNILNKKRFFDEYTGGEIAMPHKNPKPEDYQDTFAGNTDDNFKIGLAVSKKSLKLYSDFYSSDILIASPLGLRVLIGAEGEKDRDFDFLASLEILVLDGADIFAMQNWDHVMHLANHLHLQPSASSTTRSGTDFSRVRPWAVEGHTMYYRQSIMISGTPLPGPAAFFASKCKNYEGAVRVANAVLSGSICQIVLQMPQVFHRVDVATATEAIDARFETFTNKVLMQYKDKITKHVLIYVPQYFDYIRIRNYMKKEEFSFVQVCEYSKDSKVARARDMFFHGKVLFLLYSERFHFFRRVRIKGIKHIIFYQPPSYPHFYSELCNFMQAGYQRKNQQDNNVSVAVIYSRHDAEQLAGIVGSDRAAKMINSVDRNVHMFVTGE